MRIDYPYLHKVVCSLGRKINLKKIEYITEDFEPVKHEENFKVLGHVQINTGNTLQMDDYDTDKNFVRVYFKYNTKAKIPEIKIRKQIEYYVSWYGDWYRLTEIDQHQGYGFVTGLAEKWEGVGHVV